MPQYDELHKRLLRSAFIGFSASLVRPQDCCFRMVCSGSERHAACKLVVLLKGSDSVWSHAECTGSDVKSSSVAGQVLPSIVVYSTCIRSWL